MKKILTYTIIALCVVAVSITIYAHQSPPKHSNLVAEHLEALAQGEGWAVFDCREPMDSACCYVDCGACGHTWINKDGIWLIFSMGLCHCGEEWVRW